ncbi:MAG: SpoIIE family protein phosphatase [Treponema sp.]|jgi:serine phosphatase RsbU (regulator of sigma subunit)|nr:SpoIIE family protein phosphatase [Treponema sp.]
MRRGRNFAAPRRFLFFSLLLFGFLLRAGAQELFWENPVPFGSGGFPVSAHNGSLSVVAWQESSGGAERGRIGVSLAVKEAAGEWRHRGVIGSYDYSGEEPSILSVALDSDDRILIAVGASTSQTDILVSDDRGISFDRYYVQSGSESSVAPRIFTLSDGNYILFVSRGRDQDMSLYYALSDDGAIWSDFEPFVTGPGYQFTFLPSLVSKDGADYAVFQSQAGGNFHLFFRSSSDSGKTWSTPLNITNFQDPAPALAQVSPAQFGNDRAHLSVQQGRLFVVWERRYQNRSPQIYGLFLDDTGSALDRPQRINSDEAYCNNPVAFELDSGGTAVVWFDNSRGGRRVFMSRRIPGGWERGRDLSGTAGGEAAFVRPVRDSGGIYIFWQGTVQGENRIYSLFPDTTVLPPRLRADNFAEGRRNRSDLVRISWNIPDDSSDIEGYSWSWSRNARDTPPRRVMLGAFQTALEQNANTDGTWYLAVRAKDMAGNWSNPVRIAYVRDTTPPPMANIIEPETDGNGFLLSNTFDMRWNTPPASDVAGYTWSMEYLGPSGLVAETGDRLNEEASRLFSPAPPPQLIMGTENAVSFENEDNGLWCFSVSAIDEVGNIGQAARMFFKMNKYVPHTFITFVDSRQDEQGYLTLSIIGRGFAEGGLVSRIILDRDGQEPYDLVFQRSGEQYRVFSDREIGEIRIADIEEGLYRVIVQHPIRGIYMTPPLVSVDNMGTIKFGDFGRVWKPSWTLHRDRKFVFDAPIIIIAVVAVFCVLGLVVSIRGIASVMGESAAIRLETIALITGDIMPSERKKRMTRIKRKGAGLRLKLASFTIGLVLFVVLMVSTPLYFMMTKTQEETLLTGLWDRSSVLLEGIASSARAYMPTRNLLELGYLPDQSAAVPEARYITITGYGAGEDIYYNHVLATNDPKIKDKIDTAEFQNGVSMLTDVLSHRTQGIADELNERATMEVGELSASLTSLLREAMEIVESRRTDAESEERLRLISVTTASLQTRINERLVEISREIGSEPAFVRESLGANTARTYIFFKPVLYRQSNDNVYYRGLIRLEVSIDSIIDEISAGQFRLLQVILVVALAALAIGTIGAFVLSTLIIRPIINLVGHVERIRDTEDKTKLEGVDIEIKTHDELAVLGNTINDMTHGLVKAAAAASDLSLGKEIQKKFIPLEVSREGDKLSTGFKDTKNLQFFGYYEGAKGVSGDYFDYQDLDGRYFAVIKCDVAGKGIPAALIMIQVATMFINFFRRWKPTEKGLHIEDLVYQINDFLENLGFKGRFAAFTLCLFDSQTGLTRFCNAGDNIVHWFDASEGCMKTVSLRETPATGVLPNFLVESKGGYTVQTLTLDRGDILFLYTDGIEEAKRKFRDAAFREIICEEGEKDTPHATHTVGQGDEEMGPDRVFDIINAVMNKQVYILHKYHNPEGDENDLKFDFSTCEGKVEEAIMAMVSVEKIFRMYKNPRAAEDSRVLVDKKVDEFLRRHFLQYRNYCLDTRENPGNDAYMYYTHVAEDDQYDDLTILGLHRK